MAKKIGQTMKVNLEKNLLLEKGGAWLLEITILEDGSDKPVFNQVTAWANARVAKNWTKKIVVENTPRKSIKFADTKLDTNGKPTSITGELVYKVEA